MSPEFAAIDKYPNEVIQIKQEIINRLALYDDALLTRDVASLLGVQSETIRRLIYAGKLRFIRYDGDYVIAKSWFIDYLDKNEIKPSYQERFDKTIREVLDFCVVPRTYKEILALTGCYDKAYLQKRITRPLLKAGKLRLTIPESPHHNEQKYVTVIHSLFQRENQE